MQARVPYELQQAVEEYALSNEVTFSAAIRELITQGLDAIKPMLQSGRVSRLAHEGGAVARRVTVEGYDEAVAIADAWGIEGIERELWVERIEKGAVVLMTVEDVAELQKVGLVLHPDPRLEDES